METWDLGLDNKPQKLKVHGCMAHKAKQLGKNPKTYCSKPFHRSRILNPKPKPSTLNPKPATLNPQPSTLSPKPSTLNPKSSTLSRPPKMARQVHQDQPRAPAPKGHNIPTKKLKIMAISVAMVVVLVSSVLIVITKKEPIKS